MRAQHTPGPWVIDSELNAVRAEDHRHTIICRFVPTLSNPDVMADALLIAAAPDLLSALEEVLRHAISPVEFDYLKKGIGTNTPKGKAIRAANKAYIKATGGPA
jgi:hypothetical protein